VANLEGTQCQSHREVGLAHPRRSKQHHVGRVRDEGARGELVDERAIHAGGEVEVEGPEPLAMGQACEPETGLVAAMATLLALDTEERGEEVQIRRILLGGSPDGGTKELSCTGKSELTEEPFCDLKHGRLPRTHRASALRRQRQQAGGLLGLGVHQ